jgi:hypothetical protein
MPLTSIEIKHKITYRFPFVSSDILSSSYKLAEAITKSGER